MAAAHKTGLHLWRRPRVRTGRGANTGRPPGRSAPSGSKACLLWPTAAWTRRRPTHRCEKQRAHSACFALLYAPAAPGSPPPGALTHRTSPLAVCRHRHARSRSCTSCRPPPATRRRFKPRSPCSERRCLMRRGRQTRRTRRRRAHVRRRWQRPTACSWSSWHESARRLLLPQLWQQLQPPCRRRRGVQRRRRRRVVRVRRRRRRARSAPGRFESRRTSSTVVAPSPSCWPPASWCACCCCRQRGTRVGWIEEWKLQLQERQSQRPSMCDHRANSWARMSPAAPGTRRRAWFCRTCRRKAASSSMPRAAPVPPQARRRPSPLLSSLSPWRQPQQLSCPGRVWRSGAATPASARRRRSMRLQLPELLTACATVRA